MRYIMHTRFKSEAICGEVNIPATTPLTEMEGFIFYDESPLFLATSQNALDHACRDDDGQGLERGRLTKSIQSILNKKDTRHQDRWDKVWDDELCQKYKRKEHADYWLWNHKFYNAPIEDLKYIEALIKSNK